MTRPIRVLHVDDSPDMLSLTRTVLEREPVDYEIETVDCAEKALSQMDTSTFDCIVSDYEMPVMDGLAFLEAVRDRDSSVPFILFTGKQSEDIASQAIENGATDHLEKGDPETYVLLANRIENAVKQREAEVFRRATRHDPVRWLERFDHPFFAVDTDWCFTYMNDAAQEIFGTEERLIGRSIWETFPVAKETPFYDHYRDALETGQSRTVEEYFAPWDKWYREHICPGEDGLTVLSQDITDQKRREAELERERDLRRYAEELTEIGGWEFNVETGKQRWTDGTYRIHDLDPDGDFDPTREAGIDFYHPEDRQEIATAVEGCVEEGVPYQVELRLITARGRTRWVRTNGEPLQEDGQIVGARGAIEDITELVLLERGVSVLESVEHDFEACDTRESIYDAVLSACQSLFAPVGAGVFVDGPDGLEPVTTQGVFQQEEHPQAESQPPPTTQQAAQLPIQAVSKRERGTDVRLTDAGHTLTITIPRSEDSSDSEIEIRIRADDDSFDDSALRLASLLGARVDSALSHIR